MKHFFLMLLVLFFIIPTINIHSQDEYSLQNIKELLSQSDQKRIEKAEKYLVSANELMKAGKDMEAGGKSKTKAANKKLSAAGDFGSAHKIIYDVYADNVQKQLSGASSENAKNAKKSIDDGAKWMKEAKKKRELSLRNNVAESAFEMAEQALELEKKAIAGLAENYLLLSGGAKNTKNEKTVITDPKKINKDQDVKKEDNVENNNQLVEDKENKKSDVVKTEDSKLSENQDNKKSIVVIDEDVNQEELSKKLKEDEKKGVYFKLQIAASKTPLSVDQLNSIYKTNEMFNVEKEGEWYKYSVSQRFTKYEEALAYKENLKIKGIFIIAYKNGNRVSIDEALKKDEVKNEEVKKEEVKKEIIDTKKTEPNDNKTNIETKTIFRVQLAVSLSPMNAKEISLLKTGGKPVLTFDHGGWYSYNVGDFNTKQEALNYKKAKGLTDATVVKFENGILIEE